MCHAVEMNELPAIDTHYHAVGVSPEATWRALKQFVAKLTRPAPKLFQKLWHLEPAGGFDIAEAAEPVRMVLRGHHRFARYELTFAIEPTATGATLSARSNAEFPKAAGFVYRALVIGTGGHEVVVRHMLKKIARAAESGH